jgi:tripartite-type tricarboxylate transporter receptor subunit TctC
MTGKIMLQRRTLIGSPSTALLLGLRAGAHAQTTDPTKPVKFAVAFAPGGPADIIARLLGQRLSVASSGQPVVVENRAGAGGNVASGIVAKAAPDGYTLMINTSSLAVNVSLSKNPGLRCPTKTSPWPAWWPLAPICWWPDPGLKAKNLQEIVAEAEVGQAQLRAQLAGAGTTPHLTAEYLFKVLARGGCDAHSFSGSRLQRLNATMGGQVEMASVALPAAVEMVKGGKVRGLAVTSNKRVSALPDVPTVAESGFPGFEDYTWVGVFAPSKTPPHVVQHLNSSEINKILRSADFQAKLAGVEF